MTHAPEALPARRRPARRRNADYRWTDDKVFAFLHALAHGGSVARAARAVGMSRQAAYALRARLAGPAFNAFWDRARAAGKAHAAALRTGARPASPWGQAGLHRGRELAGQGDTSGVQADTWPSQVDTPAPQADVFGAETGVLPLDSVPCVPGSPAPMVRNRHAPSAVMQA